jgi:hypothetical protein
MVMKKVISLVLCLVFVVALTSCGSKSEKIEDNVIGKKFIYSGEGLDGDDFAITFNEDNTFTYSEGRASSHLGYGEWSIEGKIITLVENLETDKRKNRFEINDNQLKWLEEGSSNFIYVKLKNGEVFQVE